MHVRALCIAGMMEAEPLHVAKRDRALNKKNGRRLALAVGLKRSKKKQKKLDSRGVDPLTSCMLSARATSCANRPSQYDKFDFAFWSRRRIGSL